MAPITLELLGTLSLNKELIIHYYHYRLPVKGYFDVDQTNRILHHSHLNFDLRIGGYSTNGLELRLLHCYLRKENDIHAKISDQIRDIAIPWQANRCQRKIAAECDIDISSEN